MKFKSIFTKKRLSDFLAITMGVAIASFAFSFFLNVNNIVIGGISGISIIIKEKLGREPSTVMLILNIGLLVFGFLFLGKEFLIKNAYGSIMYPVFVFIFDKLYQVIASNTNINLSISSGGADYILVILFSSILMGIGLGYVMKHGASTGGTETPQCILFQYCHIPYSLSLYLIDGIVIVLGFVILKQDVNTLLYELIFMYISGIAMDTIIFSGFNKRAVYIISNKTEEIMNQLLYKYSRGVTSIRVVGEFTRDEKKMLLCVLSSAEYYKLRSFIEKVDDKAFFYTVRASEVRGEGFSYEKELEDEH